MEKLIKNILVSLLLINTNLFYSQEAGFIPPSPQSFSFIKAGSEVSENEHTGSVNVNIPLFNYITGKLSTGINLVYNGAGVKVDDLPTDTGMAWVLDAGGVVTRTVNGRIDEKATMRLNKTEDQIKQTTISDCTADNDILTACYSPTQIDTERDIFDFRFGVISGSFYLDENFLPIFLKNDSDVRIKNILPSGSTNNRQFIGFEITTKEGEVYIFGNGDEYQETTASKAMPSNPPGDYAVTSYFLKEIRHQNSEKIFFTYSNIALVKKDIAEIHYRYLYSTGLNSGIMPDLDPELKTSTQTHFTKNKKRLQQISNNVNRDVINFIYAQKANSDFDAYLSQVEYGSGGSIPKKIVLDYFFESLDPIQRFYISAANFYNGNVFDKKYQFSYNNIEALPKRLSYSQDMFGFYNGKGGGSLIAKYYGVPALSTLSIPSSILSSFGDRTPDFAFASKGTLTEVIYPTGGKTVFEYEMPKTKVLLSEKKILPDLDDLGTTTVIEGLPTNQTIDFVLTTFSGPQSQYHMKTATFTVEDMDTGALIHTGGKVYGYSPMDSVNYMVPLEMNKRYLVKLTDTGPAGAELKFNQTYRKTIDWLGLRLKSITNIENGQPVQYKKFYYCAADLYKLREEDLRDADGVIMPDVQFATFNEFHTDGLTSASFAVTYSLYSSNNTSALYNSRRQSRYSTVSCSIGGDNFENGGYQKRFRKDSEDNLDRIRPASAGGGGAGSPSAGHGYFDTTEGMPNFFAFLLSKIYFPARGNRTSFSGGLENIKYFGRRNGEIFKTKQINYQNRYNILGINPNLFVSKVFDDNVPATCGSNNNVQRIANFYIATYKNYTIDTKLEKQITTEYIDGVPLHIYPTYADYLNNGQLPVDSTETSYKKLVTTIDYDYTGMPAHNQLTKQSVESPDKSILETTYQYAHEKNNQKLIAAHMIGVPLEAKTIAKQNNSDAGKIISRSETIYPDQNNPPTSDIGNLLMPLSLISYSIQNNTPSTEITYNWYDQKGNLMQYMINGLPVTIVWGYNKTLPIAKIEGAEYRSVAELSDLLEAISASEKDADPALYNLQPENTETQLINKLDELRTNPNLVNFKITTYTYDPLIGVRSITPPSGIREVYKYDTANRLEKIIDANGKVLKEYKYTYKN
ncbi:hypothetical protein ACM40_12115 [Chryseobacterium sp. BLS98]|uniref:hypothetical protein n=1 Tax=Chryseobacterium sp. BLS98 TaxID=885586 RepID=UPI00065AAFAF|nr:hypothetical protein [Chryseobacterium sp. BLS98]KMQ60517.1 hypothetical protein ACM40_12115 [Chryseobacterium sp. BLS98]